MPPALLTATSRLPSADDATPVQLVSGAVFVIQVAPALVEVKIWPLLATATSRMPLVEEATELQEAVAKLATFQIWAEAESSASKWKITTAQMTKLFLVFMAG